MSNITKGIVKAALLASDLTSTDKAKLIAKALGARVIITSADFNIEILDPDTQTKYGNSEHYRAILKALLERHMDDEP